MKRPRLGIFVAFFAFYLLTESREALWADSKAAYLVAEHFVAHGKIDISYGWPPGQPPARDGKYYSVYPILPSLVQVPAAWFQWLIKRAWPGAAAFTFPLATHASCAALAALACALFFGLCRKLGVSPLASSLTTLALGAGSLLWPYAHDPFSEALQTVCFTGLFAEIIETEERRHRGLALGVWAGLLLNAKLIFALALPGAAIYLLARLWGDWRRVRTIALFGLVGLAPFVALSLAYSYARWGSFVDVSVAANQASFGENALFGLWGFTASLGRSIFRYSPPLVVSLLGLPRLWRTHRRVAVAALLTTGPIVYVYCKYAMWPGDHAWGPRYLLFLHPLALIPAALVLDALIARGLRPVHKAALGLVLAAGIAVQILGVVLWRGNWIRISHDVAQSWLGKPRRTIEGGIEDFYMRVWMPAFDPMAGHLWLLRHVWSDDPAEIAQRDGPWRRYTALNLPLGNFYRNVRIDWWPFLWTKDFPQYRVQGLILLGTELALLAAGAAMWIVPLRPRRRADDQGANGPSIGAMPHS